MPETWQTGYPSCWKIPLILWHRQLSMQGAFTPGGTRIGLTEMYEYGYSWDEMLPLTKERATEFFQNDVEIYQLHVDGAETLIEDMEDIEAHGGIFGVEKS